MVSYDRNNQGADGEHKHTDNEGGTASWIHEMVSNAETAAKISQLEKELTESGLLLSVEEEEQGIKSVSTKATEAMESSEQFDNILDKVARANVVEDMAHGLEQDKSAAANKESIPELSNHHQENMERFPQVAEEETNAQEAPSPAIQGPESDPNDMTDIVREQVREESPTKSIATKELESSACLTASLSIIVEDPDPDLEAQTSDVEAATGEHKKPDDRQEQQRLNSNLKFGLRLFFSAAAVIIVFSLRGREAKITFTPAPSMAPSMVASDAPSPVPTVAPSESPTSDPTGAWGHLLQHVSEFNLESMQNISTPELHAKVAEAPPLLGRLCFRRGCGQFGF